MIKSYLRNFISSCVAGLLLLNLSSAPTTLWDELLNKVLAISLVNTLEEPFKITVLVTGYSSTPDQTDSTPFHTASGAYVYDGVVAANFLAFDTQIQIPELYGDKVFTVEDRMNSRYNDANPHRLDIWFSNRVAAKKFGVQKLEIIILDKKINKEISKELVKK